jgi:GTPase SAR1 family protein
MEIVKEDKKDIDKMIKACFVGSASAGKTSLIRRLKG